MKRIKLFFVSLIFFVPLNLFSQDSKINENINTNKFRQLYQEFSSPNMYRTASGARTRYFQQQADYKINVELDDINKKLYGDEIITYTNNSPDQLDYLWVQLDQNIRSKDSPSLLHDSKSVGPAYIPDNFEKEFINEPFDGGFNIEYVNGMDNKPLDYIINQTMMRIDMFNPLKTEKVFHSRLNGGIISIID